MGYLVIEFSGEFCEEILNIAARNHISLWNLTYRKGKITGCITIKDFKRIRLLKRKGKTKIKILERCGLPFKTVRYKGRAGFIIGAAIFVFVLNFLSGFIWNIEVCGNKRLESEEILKTCEELGIKIGISSRSINSSMMSQKLALKLSDVAWASFNVEGSKLTVNITETKLKEDDSKKPKNVKSTADGIIEKIDITGGEAQIKIGDTVREGDLLVSGVYESMNATVFDQPTGTITAKTERVFRESAKFKQVVFEDSGKTVVHRVLSIFNFNIPLYIGDVSDEYTEKSIKKNIKLIGKELPIGITTKEFNIQNKVTLQYNAEELQEILEKKINEQIKKLKITEYETVDTKIIEEGDGIILEKRITAHENIAYFEDILIDSEN